MGRSAGAGSPVFFRCAKERLGHYHDKDSRVELTGRKKPVARRKWSMAGTRSTLIQREYRCTCGHVGWSNHVDLLVLELGRNPTFEERRARL